MRLCHPRTAVLALLMAVASAVHAEDFALIEKMLIAGGAQTAHQDFIEKSLGNMNTDFAYKFGAALESQNYATERQHQFARQLLNRHSNQFRGDAEIYVSRHVTWQEALKMVYGPACSDAFTENEVKANLSYFETEAGQSLAKHAPLRLRGAEHKLESAFTVHLRAFVRDQMHAHLKLVRAEMEAACKPGC